MDNLILVTGSEGLVGSRFTELYPQKNLIHAPKRIEFDIADSAQVKAIVKSYDFKAIVHFAAYTDVSRAEEERNNKEGDCWKVNVEGTRNLVSAIKQVNKKIHFIHISTDMVFSGNKKDPGPYLENHLAENDLSQLTWYGFTKAEAERIVRNIMGDEATILRIIYPVRAKFEEKLDYLRKPLKLYDEGKLYPLFSDQQISITYIDEACILIEKIISEKITGTYHASSRDTTTPYELVSYLIEKARGVQNVVKAVKLEDFLKNTGSPSYRYPRFGGLSVDITESRFNMKFSDWRDIVNKLSDQEFGKRD